MKTVRVRFAPSPTGHLHIGGLRTALFNWLFARHYGGKFILRIEDTDKERSYSKFVDSILTSLQWAGLSSDEPLVFQSERMDVYRRFIDRLLKDGKAYRCFCPPAPGRVGEPFLKYDGKCRSLNVTSEQEKEPHVIRFKFPLDYQEIGFEDLIRGPITFSIDQFDDFILVRTDGTPMYNFVVVVDDAEMKITHIIRGEDHISNTPKQIALYQALGFDIPFFAHVPLILGSEGQRLSKREAAVSVLEYKQQGYLADALCNYLVRLGWAHGDQEVFSREELVRFFTLNDVGKSGAIFDAEKLDWLNGIYIRQATPEELFEYSVRDVEPDLEQKLSLWSKEQILLLLHLYQDRVSTLLQLVAELISFHDHSRTPLQTDLEKWVTADTYDHLKLVVEELQTIAVFSSQALSKMLKEFATKNDLKLVSIAQPLRLALTGKASGPGVFELLALLGKEESIRRIEQFLSSIGHMHRNR